jgi:NAD(P)-dependent dehydrogenase (short-subunit alcohol dehydrogenase family)
MMLCVTAGCVDKVQNGSETDVDCGGSCADCANGATCGTGGDCVSGVCTGGICQVPTCADGVKNGSETGLDCGGPSCADCPAGQGCANGGDCVSGVCTGNVCQNPSCSDGVKNGSEPGVDCGGSCAAAPRGAANRQRLPNPSVGDLCRRDVLGRREEGSGGVDCGGARADCALNGRAAEAATARRTLHGRALQVSSQLFTFREQQLGRRVRSAGGPAGPRREWPTGAASPSTGRTTTSTGCTIASPFSVNSFAGYRLRGTGGEDGDAASVSCPPAGIGSCCSGRVVLRGVERVRTTAARPVQCSREADVSRIWRCERGDKKVWWRRSPGCVGLGACHGRDAGERGAKVAILDRPSSAGEVAAAIGSPRPYPGSTPHRTTVATATLDARLDHVVAPAVDPAAHLRATVVDGMSHGFRAVVELNLIASFDFLRLCAERMARNAPNADGERGVVISTASIAAFEGQIGQVAYAAAKSGIVGMTFVAARDLGSLGVRAMCIAPSLFQTGLTQGIPDEMAAGLTRDAAFPKRMGRPIEYARMALAIIENPMLNGSTIRLDGGQRFAPK